MLTDSLRRRLAAAFAGQMKDQRATLGRAATGLDALSPLKVLGRGYAIARKGRAVVSSIVQTDAGDQLDVAVSDGVIQCEVRTCFHKQDMANGRGILAPDKAI